MDVIKAIEHEQLKETVPVLDVGNTVRVSVKLKKAKKKEYKFLKEL